MLRHDLTHERFMAQRLLLTIETAQDLEDEGSKTVLKRVLVNAEERALILERVLNDLSDQPNTLT